MGGLSGNPSGRSALEAQILGDSKRPGLAPLCGWTVFHLRPGRTKDGAFRSMVAGQGVGFPDFVLVRPPRLIFAECKGDRGYPSPAQRMWLRLLALVPVVEVYVWRPRDFATIRDLLARDVSPVRLHAAQRALEVIP